MEIKQYEILLEAETPIATHCESIGNEAIFMRRKVRQRDGRFVQVPEVTGDTMRHGLREAAAYAFLDAAGLLDGGELPEAAVRLLFAGGMITGRGDASVVNMDRFREMVELCPPLALLGGCADNRSIPSRLMVDAATLVCHEQHRYLPEWVHAWLKDQGCGDTGSYREQMEVCTRVRMDPILDPAKRHLLSESAQVEVGRRLTAGEKAHSDDDAVAREEAKSTMLPRSFERLAQGSLFHWRVTCQCLNDLDVDTFHTVLGVFLGRCIVGGKKATGHGRLRPVAARDIAIARPAEQTTTIDTKALGGRVGSIFRAHVQERREQIKTWMASVNA